MPVDRLLTTVLKAFQGAPDPVQNNKILATTTSLLTTLTNPLNVTILTSQLLTAPALWTRVDGLQTSLRIISIFNTAAITVREYQLSGQQAPYDAYQPRKGGGISCDDWARAVVKGADERSPRWQHLLVIAGVLLGMEGQERRALSRGLKSALEGAMVTAANLALEEPTRDGLIEGGSIALALNHAFQLLSDTSRRELNYDELVMVLVKAMTSSEGYRDGAFLTAIDANVVQVAGNRFDWSSKSPSFTDMQQLASQPLVTSMGPLSRLIAHSIENMKGSLRIVEIREHLLSFTNSILAGWQRNKLSEVDASEEQILLTPETLQSTLPILWQVLKGILFATVVSLRAIIGRTLIDRVLSDRFLAPITAARSLFILRNLHFISSRVGSNALTAYTFVNLASIDILTCYPLESREFLQVIYPSHAGHIPPQPLQRNLDLFYLNTSEHFTLVLSPSDNETLIITPASPYLNPTANAYLVSIFEAAHSATLAVLAAPRNPALTNKVIPFYVEALFNSFPTHLSPRQFRFAFKSLMTITTPPSPLSVAQPLLSETLLEFLHFRALHASTSPLPPSLAVQSEADAEAQAVSSQPPLSEQAVLLLTLLDALPTLPLQILREWLPLSADLLNTVSDRHMREHCKLRFWEVIVGGEMDVERSAVCVTWWSTKGGRARVLYGDDQENEDPGPFMSGGLGVRDGSRL